MVASLQPYAVWIPLRIIMHLQTVEISFPGEYLALCPADIRPIPKLPLSQAHPQHLMEFSTPKLTALPMTGSLVTSELCEEQNQ